jgi:hypothetical protein
LLLLLLVALLLLNRTGLRLVQAAAGVLLVLTPR